MQHVHRNIYVSNQTSYVLDSIYLAEAVTECVTFAWEYLCIESKTTYDCIFQEVDVSFLEIYWKNTVPDSFLICPLQPLDFRNIL